ncbi:hypothetical protein ND010_08570 [Neisseria gonorrhoeae]|nr:hypothetical protein [Neisseria gonorrhoeae]UYA63272.1 hypothetical protein ND010_08570 [Neisseria gonorrhoeae]
MPPFRPPPPASGIPGSRPHAAQNAFRRVSAVFRALPPLDPHAAAVSPKKSDAFLKAISEPPQKSVVGISP